jgi:protease-4
MKDYFLWLAKFITKVVVVIIAVPFLIGIVVGAMEGFDKESLTSPGKDKDGHVRSVVSVVTLEGVITESKSLLDVVEEEINKKEVKAMVLRINSPGGAVGPSQEMFMRLRALGQKKPIVASMETVAASGGMYAAAGCKKIYALPGTLTGSIGVIIQFPNLAKITDLLGVKMVTVTAGKLKDVGNMFRDMTPEERSFLESITTETHEDFIRSVALGRNLSVDDVRKFADGRVITGSQAKTLGLIDELGGVHEAAIEALKIAGITDENPELRYPKASKLEEFKKALSQSRSSLGEIIGFSGWRLLYRAPGI